jgi:hypothetical protein
MLFRERVTVYCENHTEHKYTQSEWGKNVELLNFKKREGEQEEVEVEGDYIQAENKHYIGS